MTALGLRALNRALLERQLLLRRAPLGIGEALELRVYRRGATGHDVELSFDIGRLWQVARGEALDIDEIDRFARFCGLFAHQPMGLAEKIERVAQAEPWRQRAGARQELQIDLEFLVSQLRKLSRLLADDAAAQHERLLADLELNPDHDRRLRLELETLAREIEPGADAAGLPATAAGVPCRRGRRLAGVVAVPDAGLAAHAHADPAVPILGGRGLRRGLPLRRRLRAGLRAPRPQPAPRARRGVPARPRALPLAVRGGEQLRLVQAT